jgi:hypothetical protein
MPIMFVRLTQEKWGEFQRNDLSPDIIIQLALVTAGFESSAHRGWVIEQPPD